MHDKTRKILYLLEFALLFFALPLLLLTDRNIIYPSALLLPVFVALVFYLYKQKDFHLRDLIRLNIPKQMWIRQAFIVTLSGFLLFIFVLIFEPENLFNLPKGNPLVWIAMFFFYPVFSAYAQEVVFRLFLFIRYRKVFSSKWAIILASAVTFSFAHILYFSLLSIVLTFLAGIYLALIYYKTRSVLFSSILHGMLGFLIFTVGLGQHFWINLLEWIK